MDWSEGINLFKEGFSDDAPSGEEEEHKPELLKAPRVTSIFLSTNFVIEFTSCAI